MEAGVKTDDPVRGLNLSMLTDLWRSPRSRMKNFKERETTAKGLLYEGERVCLAMPLKTYTNEAPRG